jgi:hypothetical protein
MFYIESFIGVANQSQHELHYFNTLTILLAMRLKNIVLKKRIFNIDCVHIKKKPK